jgi:hypothetical protein
MVRQGPLQRFCLTPQRAHPVALFATRKGKFGAGAAQNNLCASKGRYSRTFDLSHCDHYNR